jgi:hypothetical protein
MLTAEDTNTALELVDGAARDIDNTRGRVLNGHGVFHDPTRIAYALDSAITKLTQARDLIRSKL